MSLKKQEKKIIRSAYGPRDRVRLNCNEKTRTKQQFKGDCDINSIVKQHSVTGVLEHVQSRVPVYGDARALDYQEAMNLVISAQESFEGLPSNIRRRFDNDPKKFIEFIDNPKNEDEARELGLLNPSKASEDSSSATPKVSSTKELKADEDASEDPPGGKGA